MNILGKNREYVKITKILKIKKYTRWKKINGRLDIAEAKIYTDDIAIEIIWTETQGKNQAKKKKISKAVVSCAPTSSTLVHLERREKGNIFAEIIDKGYPDL